MSLHDLSAVDLVAAYRAKTLSPIEVIRAVLVTHLHGNAPQVSVESGRKMVPNEHMPTFLELEEAVQSVHIT